MTIETAARIVDGTNAQWSHCDVPSSIQAIADRQREHLVSLALALLSMDKSEAEVIQLIENAAASFNRKLHAQLANGE
jgi:hypothetical protein